MKKVTPENLKAGDVLAKDIVSDKGLIVLKKGAVLTDKFIGNIQKLNQNYSGVTENYIFIEGSGDAVIENSIESKEKMEKELSLLEKRFRYAEIDEYTKEIKEIIKNVIIKNYGGNAI